MAAEKEAALAAEKETARLAAEKEAALAAEKETARLAAEKEAALAAERFKPAAGAEIVPGIKVDQKVSVEGVNWTAVGKVEDRVVFKKDSGIERSKTPQEFKPGDFNRVEISGEKGTYFQRKGSNTLYQYIPMDGKQGLEPGPGNGFIFKLDGVEAKPLGSPVVRAMLKSSLATPETKVEPVEVAKPATEPVKPAKDVLAPHQLAAVNALDKTIAEAQKYMAEKPVGEAGTFKFAEPLKLNFHDKPLTVSAIEVVDGKMYLKSATDGMRYSADAWLNAVTEGLQERSASTTIAAADAQAAKLSLEALSASPEARIALIKALATNFAAETKAIAPAEVVAATTTPLRKGGAPSTGAPTGNLVASGGGTEIRPTEAGGYEVKSPKPGETALAGKEAVGKEEIAKLRSNILEDKERKYTPEEKRRALQVLELAERGNVEAREALRGAVGRGGGIDKATGTVVGVGLVVTTLAGWYAYEQMKSARNPYVARASVN